MIVTVVASVAAITVAFEVSITMSTVSGVFSAEVANYFMTSSLMS